MLFTQTHEWADVEGQIATIGISEHAQKELGEVVYVELPAIGRSIKAGDDAAVLESTKAAVDIYTPLSGEIVAVNDKLRQNPELINQAAESLGWLFKLRLHHPKELETLMPLAEYRLLIP
jgi:glycine cleavage system H protein